MEDMSTIELMLLGFITGVIGYAVDAWIVRRK